MAEESSRNMSSGGMKDEGCKGFDPGPPISVLRSRFFACCSMLMAPCSRLLAALPDAIITDSCRVSTDVNNVCAPGRRKCLPANELRRQCGAAPCKNQELSRFRKDFASPSQQASYGNRRRSGLRTVNRAALKFSAPGRPAIAKYIGAVGSPYLSAGTSAARKPM